MCENRYDENIFEPNDDNPIIKETTGVEYYDELLKKLIGNPFDKSKMDKAKSKSDPDANSRTLRELHKILWSKELPNGEQLDLVACSYNGLKWEKENITFSSDSIGTGFIWSQYAEKLQEFYKIKGDQFLKDIHEFTLYCYTIGVFIIFPRYDMNKSINVQRGRNALVKDRFDITLECIRKFYLQDKTDNPLYEVFDDNKSFFALFTDFKGYVDFFFLQDMINDDYTKVKPFLSFKNGPLPRTADEYDEYRKNSIEFIKKRNERIKKYLNEKK